MLPCRHLFENFDLAHEALSHWEHEEELFEQFRISSNAIYPFRRAGKVCFLRLAPVEEKREENIKGELEFLTYLEAQDYPAVRPIPAGSGERLLRLETRWGTYYASAFLGVPGIRLDRLAPTPALLRSYGRALGKLHALSSVYRPACPKWDYAQVLDWARSALERCGASGELSAQAALLRRELDALPRTPGCYGLVHYDFEPDNVFYEERTGLCIPIDFDDGMFHWYVLDVEQVFDSLDDMGVTDPAPAQAAFLAGYREEFDYPQEWEALRPLMRCFVDFYGLARLTRAMAQRLENEPDWLTQLRARLSAVVAEKEARILGR